MSRNRRGPVEAFFSNPEIRGAVTRLVTDVALPNAARFLQDMHRGYRFPKCLAIQPNPQMYGCVSPGVGACQQCKQPFCANHGLLFLSGVFDDQRMLAMLDKPVIGLCTSCVNRAFTLATQAAQPAAPPPPYAAPPPPPYTAPPSEPEPSPQATMGNDPEPRAAPPKAKRGAVPLDNVPPRVRQAYAVLGIPPGATVTEARKAQRRLALQYHPDKGGDVKEMQAVNDAVSVIERFFAGARGKEAQSC